MDLCSNFAGMDTIGVVECADLCGVINLMPRAGVVRIVEGISTEDLGGWRNAGGETKGVGVGKDGGETVRDGGGVS